MTKKLYYNDAYIKEFSATVLKVDRVEDGFSVLLDKTAFFPEEGGQSADGGKIDGITVKYVYENDGEVFHITESAPRLGEVFCALDFEERFEKMQIHTAEHMLSGILNKLYGAENTGFHLGEGEVTLDTDIPLTMEQLLVAERQANAAVYENREVKCFFPTVEQANEISYRSKMEIRENLRLVEVSGYDICACCAPHVKTTGEIGLIKILSAERRKGGTRVYFTAGARAYGYVSELFHNASLISKALAAPVLNIAEQTVTLQNKCAALEYRAKALECRIAELYAEAFCPVGENEVVLLEGVGTDAACRFANLAYSKMQGALVVLIPAEEGFRYVIKCESDKLSDTVKKANAALCGRGGGKDGMAQGSFKAELEAIRGYFS